MKPMKSFKVISDPEAFQLLADDTRRRIIHLLRAKEYTVAQIASEMGLTPQAIYHHIRKLKDANMVEVAREERVEHFIETYYRASAEIFYCSHGEAKGANAWDQTQREALKNLQKLGLGVKIDENVAPKLAQLQKKLSECCLKPELEGKIEALEGVDVFVKQNLMELAEMLSMTDEEFEEYQRLRKEFRELLRSGAVHKGRGKKKA